MKHLAVNSHISMTYYQKTVVGYKEEHLSQEVLQRVRVRVCSSVKRDSCYLIENDIF